VLMVAAGITFVAYALTTPQKFRQPRAGDRDSGAVLLNAVIGFAQVHAAERTAGALQALVPGGRHRGRGLRARPSAR
jgi:Ca2+-transporting ATPase